MTHGVNATSVYSVDPRSTGDFYLPDTTDAGADADPYDVRGVDEITLLVSNGADQSATITVETFAFNDEAASTVYGDVTDKEGVDSHSVAAGATEVISIGVAALAFVRMKANYGTAPASGTLSVTYQGDKQG